MEQGPTEKTIIEQCVRQKLPLPDKIANAPEIAFGLDVFYIAFMDLTSCRGTGYGTEGPISWLSINSYADAKEFEEEQREDMFYFVQKLDMCYLDYKTRKLKESIPGGGKIIGSDGRSFLR